MRHKNAGRKFGRNTSHRRAMFRNLTANLILHDAIVTTDAKAKEVRRIAERLVTKARRLGAVAYTLQTELTEADKARRLAVQRIIGAFIPKYGVVTAKGAEPKRVDLVQKVMTDLARRYAQRPGGYTRIVKLGPRRGDNAPMAILEFIRDDGVPSTAKVVPEVDAAAEAGV